MTVLPETKYVFNFLMGEMEKNSRFIHLISDVQIKQDVASVVQRNCIRIKGWRMHKVVVVCACLGRDELLEGRHSAQHSVCPPPSSPV